MSRGPTLTRHTYTRLPLPILSLQRDAAGRSLALCASPSDKDQCCINLTQPILHITLTYDEEQRSSDGVQCYRTTSVGIWPISSHASSPDQWGELDSMTSQGTDTSLLASSPRKE
ncbi:hypothetical protein E2C01_091147 [Portunus trituberculatus]|uniref:Uncharacterized protein n=1 Tax=Portunus trituberculatus TaxID=210409 RepID=A0A5B7JS04_PORTR|nr:hypothetical protein [Portunus trituberculatus]